MSKNKCKFYEYPFFNHLKKIKVVVTDFVEFSKEVVFIIFQFKPKKSNLFRSCFYFWNRIDYFLKPSSAIIALYLVISFFLR